MTTLQILPAAGGVSPAVGLSPSSSEPRHGIGFAGVTVAYRGTTVLDDFSLSVPPGEIAALIGPSGSGKTTALRAVAGFVQPTAGKVWIGDRDVTRLPPYERDLGMVVQNYALFPHMKVADNVAFGLRARQASADLIRTRVGECLAMVGMGGFGDRFPRQLSGGQQQRVAIARALAIRPSVLLLDEPLSALDAQIRRSMLEELARLHRELPSLTILYVTHDQSEALTLATRIAILRGGRLVSYGRSRDLYQSPPNRFTAEFLGRANLLPVRLSGAEAEPGFARVRFGDALITARAPVALGETPPLLCIRPHDFTLHPTPGANILEGIVQSALWLGDAQTITLAVGDSELRLAIPPLGPPPEAGQTLRVYFAPDCATLIPQAADDQP